jgi:hypothetical protein
MIRTISAPNEIFPADYAQPPFYQEENCDSMDGEVKIIRGINTIQKNKCNLRQLQTTKGTRKIAFTPRTINKRNALIWFSCFLLRVCKLAA